MSDNNASLSTQQLRKISLDGLWHNNPALVQVLGLCPLLAVTGSVVNALGLALATTLVLISSNLCVSLIRKLVPATVRLPAFVMIIASVVTCVELLMQALTYELYEILGIFIPLIVTNCIILGRADGFARKNPPLAAVLDGLMMGVGLSTVFVVTFCFTGEVIINRGGWSLMVVGISLMRTLGIGWVSAISFSLSTLGIVTCLFGGCNVLSSRCRASKCASSRERWMPSMASRNFVNALTMASAGVTVGCVMCLCLKNTVSASRFERVFLQNMTCVR